MEAARVHFMQDASEGLGLTGNVPSLGGVHATSCVTIFQACTFFSTLDVSIPCSSGS